MLTQHQIATFKIKGLLRLEKFLPIEVVRSTQEFIYQLAEKEGAWRGGSWQLSATSERPKFTKPMHKEELNILETPELLATIDILVNGQKLRDRRYFPALLFTLPQNNPWKMLPGWHTDAPRQPHTENSGVQMFTFLDTVLPRGGGTLVVSGSHRLVNEGKLISSKDITTRLKKYDYFQVLLSKKQPNPEKFLTTAGKADGVDLQVVELHGNPCDVILMDLRVLHTLSTNTANRPRVMATQRYHLESAIGVY